MNSFGVLFIAVGGFVILALITSSNDKVDNVREAIEQAETKIFLCYNEV